MFLEEQMKFKEINLTFKAFDFGSILIIWQHFALVQKNHVEYFKAKCNNKEIFFVNNYKKIL